MRQLRPAEDITVTLRDQQPISFFFRGKRYTVEQAYGPWLADGDWWHSAQWHQEEWDLIGRTNCGLLIGGCLIRDRTQNLWKMAALYD